jgi:hypothetical protein
MIGKLPWSRSVVLVIYVYLACYVLMIDCRFSSYDECSKCFTDGGCYRMVRWARTSGHFLKEAPVRCWANYVFWPIQRVVDAVLEWYPGWSPIAECRRTTIPPNGLAAIPTFIRASPIAGRTRPRGLADVFVGEGIDSTEEAGPRDCRVSPSVRSDCDLTVGGRNHILGVPTSSHGMVIFSEPGAEQ